MDNLPVASSKSGSALWLVWLIPLTALGIVAWMLFSYYADTKTKIVVVFNNGSGIVAGKSALIHRGIKVGTVSHVTVNDADMRLVDVTINVESKLEGLVAKSGASFVKVEPKVSFAEVSGLDTIISGVYIEMFQSAQDMSEVYAQKPQYRFKALSKRPFLQHRDGLYLKLTAEAGVLSLKTPVLYKKFIVGEIVDRNLSKNSVGYTIFIQKEYQDLVKNSSNFWRISAVDFKASLSGIELQVDSVASVLSGGISFDSPADDSSLKKYSFKLYDSKELSRLDDRAISIITPKEYSIDSGLNYIYYKGIRAGKVIDIAYNQQDKQSTISAKLYREYRNLANEEAYFWIDTPEFKLDNLSSIGSVLSGSKIEFDTRDEGSSIDSSFTLLPIQPQKNQRVVHLQLKRADGVRVGTSVYYRGVVIGRVISLGFASSSDRLQAAVLIQDQYSKFVNNSSQFYVDSGVNLELSMQKIELDIASADRLLSSGISLLTPDLKARSNKKNFTLYESYTDLLHRSYLADGLNITLVCPTLDSIVMGTKVLYKSLTVGSVIGIEYDRPDDNFKIQVHIKDEFKDLLNSSSKFVQQSGFELDVDISTLQLKTSTLDAFISPHITLQTADLDANSTDKREYNLLDATTIQMQKYNTFVLYIPSSKSISAGSSLLYRGVKIGRVKSMELEGSSLRVVMLIDREYQHLLHKDSWFYLKEFELSLSGVKNGSSLLSPSIVLVEGKSEQLSDKFTLSLKAPPPTYALPGLRLRLLAKSRGSIDVGTPIQYRQVNIGSVESYRLSGDGSVVELDIYIEPEFAKLVREDSVFYKVGKFELDVGFSGISVQSETLATMIEGAIALDLSSSNSTQATQSSSFELLQSPPNQK